MPNLSACSCGTVCALVHAHVVHCDNSIDFVYLKYFGIISKFSLGSVCLFYCRFTLVRLWCLPSIWVFFFIRNTNFILAAKKSGSKIRRTKSNQATICCFISCLFGSFFFYYFDFLIHTNSARLLLSSHFCCCIHHQFHMANVSGHGKTL